MSVQVEKSMYSEQIKGEIDTRFNISHFFEKINESGGPLNGVQDLVKIVQSGCFIVYFLNKLNLVNPVSGRDKKQLI